MEDELPRLRLEAIILPNWTDSPFSTALKNRSLGVFNAERVVKALLGVALDQAREVPPLLRKSGIPTSDSTAVVLRTSGTTGVAKYIRVTHANLLSVANKLQRWFDLSCDDRSASMTPAYYAGGIKVNILSSLLLGGGVSIPSGSNPENLAEWISDLRPTWFYVNPTLAQAIIENLESEADRFTADSLRFVAVSSGFLSDTVRTKLESLLRVPILEFYGLSEAGVMAANPAPPARSKPGTIGLISPGEVAINDERGCQLGPGNVGEVIVRGPSISPGYLDDPNPLPGMIASEHGQDKWLRTGDLGIIDKDQFLTIVGRMKDVINRGGEKIAPYEIENALLQHPAVREAAAFGVPHPRLGENVSAAVVFKPECLATSSELQNFLKERLAPFKIPQRVFIASTLPRTETGKIKSSELRECYSKRPLEYVPPKGDVEVLIAQVWQRLLNRPDIGADENFFEAGGDSLLTTDMLLEVEAITHRRIPQSAMEAVLTIRHLAAAIMRDNPTENELVTCAKHGTGVPFFFCHGDYDYRGVYALRLANLIDRDFPIYLLNLYQDVYADGQVTVEEMARMYVPQLLAAQPTGDFRIGGFCFGGVLAWEIAHQLETAGRKVEFVVLIDSPSLNGRIALRIAKRALKLIARFSPNEIREKINVNGMSVLWDHARRIDADDRRIVWRLISKIFGSPFKTQPAKVAADVINTSDIIKPANPILERYRSISNYLQPFVNTELFCLVCEEYAMRCDFSPVALTRLSREAHIKKIPGGHHTSITTFADELATELRQIFSTRQSGAVSLN